MSLSDNLAAVRTRLADACRACGRAPSSVQLLAVSKTFPAERLRALAAAGQHAFGESYVQEAQDKIRALAGLAVEWHFIGPVQSNKTREIAEHFDWVHSIDRDKIAQRLSAQRREALPPLNVCVQVNVSGEASKSGVAPDDTLALCQRVTQLPRLRLRGLMAIPAPVAPGADPRAPFRRLRELRETLRSAGIEADTLSAGMSDDFEHAIAEGATIIRIGTALFGPRT